MISHGKPENGKMVYDNPKDREGWLIQNEGIRLIETYKEEVNQTEKQQMYAYMYGPLFTVLVDCYREAGWKGFTKYDVEYEMKMHYGFKLVYNPDGVTLKRPLSKSEFSRDRMLQFLKDIIDHLEIDLGGIAPDSERYKLMKLKKEK